MKRKFAVYHSPGFYHESEAVIYIWAHSQEDAINAVRFFGIGSKNGTRVFPASIRCAVEVRPEDYE